MHGRQNLKKINRGEGFTYIEVVISMVILVLLFETMWLGIEMSQKQNQWANEQQEATYLSEELIWHLERRLGDKDGISIGGTTDLIYYLGEDIEAFYQIDDYDYYVAYINKGSWKSGDRVRSDMLEECYLMSTVSDSNQRRCAMELMAKLLDEGKLKLKVEKSVKIETLPESYGVIILVMKKGGTTWQELVKKQIVVL